MKNEMEMTHRADRGHRHFVLSLAGRPGRQRAPFFFFFFYVQVDALISMPSPSVGPGSRNVELHHHLRNPILIKSICQSSTLQLSLPVDECAKLGMPSSRLTAVGHDYHRHRVCLRAA